MCIWTFLCFLTGFISPDGTGRIRGQFIPVTCSLALHEEGSLPLLKNCSSWNGNSGLEDNFFHFYDKKPIHGSVWELMWLATNWLFLLIKILIQGKHTQFMMLLMVRQFLKCRLAHFDRICTSHFWWKAVISNIQRTWEPPWWWSVGMAN